MVEGVGEATEQSSSHLGLRSLANLTHWLKRAVAGEDIGILCGDKVVALRTVRVFSEDSDYAKPEYGATDAS